MLYYWRYLPPLGFNSNQLVNSSFLEDFNTILNGKHLRNQMLVFKQMAISLLKVFYNIKDTKKLYIFLVTIINIDLEVQEPFSKYSILY